MPNTGYVNRKRRPDVMHLYLRDPRLAKRARIRAVEEDRVMSEFTKRAFELYLSFPEEEANRRIDAARQGEAAHAAR